MTGTGEFEDTLDAYAGAVRSARQSGSMGELHKREAVIALFRKDKTDAERYRWLRTRDDSEPLFVMYGSNGRWGECGHSNVSDDLLDQLIDVERAKVLTPPTIEP